MRPSLMNFELLYLEDVLAGKAVIIIAKDNIYVKRKKLIASENGIFTKGLGSVTNIEDEVLDYSCECGHYNSHIFEGYVCPECNTVCKEQFAADINKFGWIDLGKYKVMTPDGMEFVKKVIGGTALDRIINYDVSLGLDGNIVVYPDKKHPFANTGLIDFYKNFEEIVTYFGQRRKKPNQAAFLIKMKKRIFTSKIPVISQLLRPAFVSNKTESVSFDRLNFPYSSIITNSDILKKYDDKTDKITANHALYAIQNEWSSLYGYIINNKIKGKKQIVRGQIQGSRMNYTARHIIVANTGEDFDIDSLVISYNSFTRLYKLEIINVLRRGIISSYFDNMTLYEIRDYVEMAEYKTKVDEYIYAAIQYILKNHKRGLYVFCNRPPSLDMGSVQFLRIAGVTRSVDEKVMKVPLTSLTPWNGDFDGDALQIFAIKEDCLIDMFYALSPKKLIISRTNTDKLYNKAFGFIKDMDVPLVDFIKPFVNPEGVVISRESNGN